MIIIHKILKKFLFRSKSKVENFRNKEIFLKPTRGNKEELALPFIRTNLLRNGGRLAFLFVKTDKNKDRKIRISEGFEKLMGDDSSPVSNLMNKLHKHDFAEKKPGRHITKINEDVLSREGRINPWCDIFCNGLDNILGRSMENAEKIEMIIFGSILSSTLSN